MEIDVLRLAKTVVITHFVPDGPSLRVPVPRWAAISADGLESRNGCIGIGGMKEKMKDWYDVGCQSERNLPSFD